MSYIEKNFIMAMMINDAGDNSGDDCDGDDDDSDGDLLGNGWLRVMQAVHL